LGPKSRWKKGFGCVLQLFFSTYSSGLLQHGGKDEPYNEDADGAPNFLRQCSGDRNFGPQCVVRFFSLEHVHRTSKTFTPINATPALT
jgi:hypothetical protein